MKVTGPGGIGSSSGAGPSRAASGGEGFRIAGPAPAAGAAQVAALDEDLRQACLRALALRQAPGAVTPRDFALERSWRACTLQFLRNIVVEPDEG